jgi:4-amino-4-deoxy-L-arabinose transferase-like glycosyltransferase
MYNDGVWYAVLSRNIARGTGEFWKPFLTETMYPEFYEHPPLGFGIQSLFFSVLGEGNSTERIYSVFIFVLAAAGACWLYGLLTDTLPLKKLWALPLVYWILNEVVYVFYPANVLEGLLSLLALGSVIALVGTLRQENRSRRIGLNILAGALLLGAFLTKGPVGLFPLAAPTLYYFFVDRSVLRRAINSTLILIGAVALFSIAIVIVWPESLTNLSAYFESQVLAAIKGERTTYHHRDNHFYLLGRQVTMLLPSVALACILFFAGRKKAVPTASKSKGPVYFALAVGFSATLPLLISPKQSFYYLLPGMVYFAVALALWTAPVFAGIWDTPRRLTLKKVIVVLLLGGVLVTAWSAAASTGKYVRRDANLIEDIDRIEEYLEPGTTIGSNLTTAHLVGYLARWHDVAIDTTKETAMTHPYLLLNREVKGNVQPTATHDNIPLDMKSPYRLWRVKD